MKFAKPTELHRKSGMWGTRGLFAGSVPYEKSSLMVAPERNHLQAPRAHDRAS